MSLLRFVVNHLAAIETWPRSRCHDCFHSIDLGRRAGPYPWIAALRFALVLGARLVRGAGIGLCFCLALCWLAALPGGHGLVLQIRTAPVAMLAPPQARRSGQAGRRPRRRPSTPTAMLALAAKSSGMSAGQ